MGVRLSAWWHEFGVVAWEDLKRWANTPETAAKVRSPDGVVKHAIAVTTGSTVSKVTRPPALLFNDIVFVETEDGDEVVVRVRRDQPDHFAGEAWAMAAAGLAGVPVPRVQGAFDIENWSVCVQTRCAGTSLEVVLEQTPSVEVLEELGAFLRRLHGIDP